MKTPRSTGVTTYLAGMTLQAREEPPLTSWAFYLQTYFPAISSRCLEYDTQACKYSERVLLDPGMLHFILSTWTCFCFSFSYLLAGRDPKEDVFSLSTAFLSCVHTRIPISRPGGDKRRRPPGYDSLGPPRA